MSPLLVASGVVVAFFVLLVLLGLAVEIFLAWKYGDGDIHDIFAEDRRRETLRRILGGE